MLYGAGKGLMFYGHVKIHINGYGYSMYSEPPRLNYYCQIQQKWSSSTSRGTKQKKTNVTSLQWVNTMDSDHAGKIYHSEQRGMYRKQQKAAT